jgi:hypothetical protein
MRRRVHAPAARGLALVAALSAAAAAATCARRADVDRTSLDAASRSYVRLALALGERDADSLDSYHGPPSWRAEAHAGHATLDQIRADAVALARSVQATAPADRDTEQARRRAFLVRQLEAIASRVGVLQGARPSFDDEARLLFGLDTHDGRGGPTAPSDDARDETRSMPVRAEVERLLPGHGDLGARYAAFERQFQVPADRLAAVVERAIERCRAATREHIALPTGERVIVEYVQDLPWSAFTRYEGRFVSRVRVNAALPLTVDRALDLACHETYPGHHTIEALLESRFGDRPEFFVQPLFSPQSALHEAAASVAPELAFEDDARVAFERDVLFPLAGLDPSGAARHVAVARLVDRLHVAVGDVTRRYLDGALDFPRAATALEHDALMPSADATLKFVNQFRSYAATYTFGRDRMGQLVGGSWDAYVRAVTDPAQAIPPRTHTDAPR